MLTANYESLIEKVIPRPDLNKSGDGKDNMLVKFHLICGLHRDKKSSDTQYSFVGLKLSVTEVFFNLKR